MAKRSYGQYCGFSRALELVGERWALMIVRDLLVGPKRFGDIARGLPGIPSNILTARLKELEEGGLVERHTAAYPQRGVLYALTADGASLEDAVLALGRWGAQRLGDPRDDEIVTEDSIAMALRTTFRPQAVRKLTARFQLTLGAVEVGAIVRNGTLEVVRGDIDDPDLVIEAGPALRKLLAREVTPATAIRKQLIRVSGKRELLDAFVEAFCI